LAWAMRPSYPAKARGKPGVPERPAGKHVEGDIGVSVIDALATRLPGYHGEDNHAIAVHQARLEERPAQGQARY